MKTLLVASACVVLVATPALACRGTAEYPETAVQLAKSGLPEAQKQEYKKVLAEGETLHRRGHELNDADLRKESLKILDDIKAKIAQ
jgi:hypothetical protein